MLAKIQSFYGFTKMPFGRDIPPGQLHRHAGHAEAVARLAWAITTRSVAVLTGEFGAGKTAAVRAALAGHTRSATGPSTCPTRPASASAASASSGPPPGFVDTIQSGTMVYEERTGKWDRLQEVHPGI